MADISFYKYLEEAFKYRLRDSKGKLATLKTKFNYIGYNLTFDRIFYHARRILPEFYRTKFPNTEQGNLQMAETVLQKLERQQDQVLVRQFTGADVSDENQQIIQEARAESQAEAIQQPTAAIPTAGPIAGGGGLPSVFSPRLPVIHNIPQTKPPDTFKGAVTAKAEKLAQESPATAKINRLSQTDTDKIPSIKTPPVLKSIPSKPTPTSPIGNPSRRINFSAFRPSASSINTVKNFTSPAGIFFKKNSGRIAGGLGEMAKGVGRGIVGPGLTGTYNLLGKAGTGGINVFARLSNQAGGGGAFGRGSFVKGSSKKIALAFLGAFLLFGIGAGILGGLTGTTPSDGSGNVGVGTAGSGCPDTSTNRSDATCRYLNPSINIFNTSIAKSAIDLYVGKYSPVFINAGKGDLSEFTKRVNYIVSNSQAAGLNPAIFLGYWKTESNFSTVGSRDMGCVGDNFYEQVDCALGINKYSDPAKNPIANCVRSRDATSIACTSLKAIRQAFDTTHPVKYPIATFDDFAESYGPYSHLSGGLHTNCTHTYNELINVAKDLSACTPTSAAPVSGGITNIVSLAGQLTQTLKKGANNLFHIKPDEPSVYYWCTYLIVDSYNAAGFNGLSRSADAAVLSMKSFFASTNGYKLLPPQTPVGQLRAGDVIFFEGSDDQHVSLIKAFDLDPNGNGAIKTYDANNVFTEDSVDVKNFQAISARTTSHKFAITGFGQIAQ